jgi:hypothetical protein
MIAMLKCIKTAVLLGLVGLMGALSGTEAQAQPGRTDYAIVTIRNPRSVTVNYQIKWGAGNWESFSVSPGFSRYHAFPVDAAGRAPRPQIRFDYILGDGGVTYKTYSLNTYTSSRLSVDSGKPHVFRDDSTGRFLDLYTE